MKEKKKKAEFKEVGNFLNKKIQSLMEKGLRKYDIFGDHVTLQRIVFGSIGNLATLKKLTDKINISIIIRDDETGEEIKV